jgi:hypothetical protein
MSNGIEQQVHAPHTRTRSFGLIETKLEKLHRG